MAAMAANSNKRWKESLDILQCPYTEGLNNEEVNHLLLNESEERLEVLEWLLVLYQPMLVKVLETKNRKTGKVSKFRIERILKAVESLCLCHAEDIDLIKGLAAVNKQKLFMNKLFDLALSRESDDMNSAKDAGAYIDSLAAQGLSLEIEDRVDLIPKDLRAEVDCSFSSLDTLRASQVECAKQIERLEEEIAELQKKVDLKNLKSAEKEVSAMTEMLSSSIQDLDQLSSGFIHSYESHIGTWCQGSQPKLNDIGPVAKRVHMQLKKIVPFLEDVDKLRLLRCDLEDNIKEHRTRKSVEAISMESNTSDNIQRCLGILEESIHRIESGFKSRYCPSLQL